MSTRKKTTRAARMGAHKIKVAEKRVARLMPASRPGSTFSNDAGIPTVRLLPAECRNTLTFRNKEQWRADKARRA